MKRLLILAAPPLLLATVGLAACSQNTQNETAEAANSIAADTEATTRNAVRDVDAATDQAFGSAERHLDNAGDHLDNAADRTDDSLDRAGDAISNGADRAANATGDALERAGRSLKN
jgi:phage-related minor tail protein